ncbi:MAG: magnesium chelatase subunit D [Hyphomonadaceae bacterium]|nr:magnesium chelatase subunit D [Hyphomonadaceae bacterium]
MNAAPSGAFDPWADALSAAALLAIDPEGLKGVIVRASPGPARDAWLAAFKDMLPAEAPIRRAPAHIDDERLLGGLDLAATLSSGRPVASRGLLQESDGGVVVLAVAERCPPATCARIAMALDAGAPRFVLVALEEGCEPDERVPDLVAERLAFALDLSTLRRLELKSARREAIGEARENLARMAPADERTIESICVAAGAFGVVSARAALFTLRAARASAALAGRARIADEDLTLAARLVLAPRAHLAPPEPAPAPESPPDQGETAVEESERSTADAVADRLVDAVQSALPAAFLAQMLDGGTERRVQARARGAGAVAKSARRGRPLGARAGALRSGDRLDLVATLRAAAPWQPIRRREATAPSQALVLVRRSDFRIRRFAQRLESTNILVVDASGSTALQRLAEAKGAVETLLAEAYVSRARVALIAFRGAGADMLLPPTRSLSRAKRALAELPGGGGTPLATAIDAASALAQSERAKGRTPLVVFLTDGRGNVARDGAPGRVQGEADALLSARALRSNSVSVVLIDTSPRVRPGAAALAQEMGAAYAPLPFVEAGAVASVVRSHAPARR